MGHSLELTQELHDQLWGHLLRGVEEQVAFIFAEADGDDNGVVFRGREAYLVPPSELLVQTPYHLTLTDRAQARVIKMAWDKGLALLELHSHRGVIRPAEFSPSDLLGLDEFVPHVRWRLRGRPYLAIVVGLSDFDALVWRNGAPEGLEHLRIGDRVVRPTCLSLRALL